MREMRCDAVGAGELMKLATDEHGLAQIRTRDYVIARLLSIRVIDPPATAGGTDYLSVSICVNLWPKPALPQAVLTAYLCLSVFICGMF